MTRFTTSYRPAADYFNDGKLLVAWASLSSGAKPSVDFGAASPSGAVALFVVTQLTLGGYTNVVINIQDSATGNTGWVDVALLTATFTDEGHTLVRTTGPVRRYVRGQVAYTGAGAAETLTAAVALARL